MFRTIQNFFKKSLGNEKSYHYMHPNKFTSPRLGGHLFYDKQMKYHQEIPKHNIALYKHSTLLFGGLLFAMKHQTEKDGASSSKNPKLITGQHACVVVYVWLPSVVSGSVGHVSLQTWTAGENSSGIYASYWPSEEATSSLQIFKPLGRSLMPSLEDDIAEEKRPPDKIIKIYSLDVEKINDAFSQFEKTNCNWHMLASSWFATKDTQNCSGLVGFLLKEGQIERLVNYHIVPYYEGTKDTVLGGGIAITSFIGLLSFIGPGISRSLGATRSGWTGYDDPKTSNDMNSYKIMFLLFTTFYGVFKLADGSRQIGKSFLITTPTDIAKLAEYAQSAEKEKFEFISDPKKSVSYPAVSNGSRPLMK